MISCVATCRNQIILYPISPPQADRTKALSSGKCLKNLKNPVNPVKKALN
jgi:hypothetical protein